MKKVFAIMVASLALKTASAQVFYTKAAQISFFSHTVVEDIKADNLEAVSFLDATKGELRFQVLIKGFQFPKATMQQHFNGPQYLNSDVFPKAEFKGTIINKKAVNYKKDGVYKVQVQGDLTLHGITKKVKQAGTITIKNGKPSALATFKIKRSDFKITPPAMAAAKIAEEIEVTVKSDYELYKAS